MIAQEILAHAKKKKKTCRARSLEAAICLQLRIYIFKLFHDTAHK